MVYMYNRAEETPSALRIKDILIKESDIGQSDTVV